MRGEWCSDPLLPRPISILWQDVSAREIRFLVKNVGRGSELLCGAVPGESISCLGPLGEGFSTGGLSPAARPLLVGGGVGVPPLVYLAAKLGEMGRPPLFFQGARTAGDLLLSDEIAAAGTELFISTEDGSAGHRGLVTELLGPHLSGDVAVFTCGPHGMLKAVAAMCAGKVPCQVSMEARMACGFGVCLGCAIPALEGGERVYKRVCKEGPVFEAEEIVWE